MSTPAIRETQKWLSKADFPVGDFIWFDLSDAVPDQSALGATWLETCRPPFEQCMVVWRGPTKSHEIYETIMIVKGDDPEEVITVLVYKGPYGSPLRALPTLFYTIQDGKISYGPVDEDDPVDELEAGLILALVAAWYRSMVRGCLGYKPVARTSFTARRKAAQGKPPTYDWKTVTIAATGEKSERKGGTHASPRQHDRRGHLRRLASGKSVWVRPCTVGDPSKGRVYHDYKITGADQ